jgi:hypothetical protein
MERHEPQYPIAQTAATAPRTGAPAFGTVDVQHLLELLGSIVERPLRIVGTASQFVVGQCMLT